MKIIWGSLIASSILLGFIMPYEDKNFSINEKLVNTTLYNASEKIEKKYKVKVIGNGAAMPEGIVKKLSLSLATKGQSKEKLRSLLINCSKDLIYEINTNKALIPYLETYPFNGNNIQITIFNSDNNGYELKDPEISTAQIFERCLIYATIDPLNTYRFKNEFTETLDEALKLSND